MSARTWFVLIFCLSAAVLQAQSKYYFPQAADGPTPSGSVRTSVAIVNHSVNRPANLTISGRRDDSSSSPISIPPLGSGSSLTAAVPPGATRLFMTDGSGDGSLAAIQITSDIAVGISGIVSNLDSNGVIQSETIAPVVSGDQLANEYLVAIDTTAGVDTAVSIYNPSASAVSIAVTLLDSSGAAAGSAAVVLGPGGHTTRSVTQDLFQAVRDFQGSLSLVSSGGNVAAVAMRRRAGAASFTLTPAVSRVSHQVRSIFPQIFDGPAPEGTLKTTFALTNLSTSSAATPSLNLTLDDGTPMGVNVPGFTAGQTIAPGGTLFWQTDGSSAALASGAAVILSDQPLAVTALLTTSDSSGNVLAESGLAPSAVNYQFRVPFDPSNGAAAGAAFLNSGTRPITLTLTLLDDSGAVITTAQSNALPAHGRLAGAISDLFPGLGTAAGSVVVSTGSPVDLSLAASSLRQASAGRFAAPALQIPISPVGTPSTVKPILDTTRTASADISTNGGSLSVTDAKGNKFTLTIPQGALMDRETITMTAITSASGISGPGLTAGVQLSPDGLALLQPALLKIDLAATAPAGTFPIGWRGTSPGVYLNSPLRDTPSLSLVLTHFSGAGVGGFDLTSELLSIANQLDLVQSAAAYWASQARFDALSGDDASSEIDGQKLLETLDIGIDTVLVPMMELAMSSDDADAMRCAVTQALGVVRQLSLLGAPDDDPHLVAANEFINYAFQRMVAKVKARCDKHDFTAYFDAIGALRQGQLLTIPVDIDPGSCPPVIELDYTSEMKGTIPGASPAATMRRSAAKSCSRGILH